MIEIDTKYGCFGHFKDLYMFMLEDHLQEVEILKVKYVLKEIFGKGVYTLEQIKKIVES